MPVGLSPPVNVATSVIVVPGRTVVTDGWAEIEGPDVSRNRSPVAVAMAQKVVVGQDRAPN